MKLVLILNFFIAVYFTLNNSVLASINIDENLTHLDISKDTLIANIKREVLITDENIAQINFQPNQNNSLALGYNNDKSLIQFIVTNKSFKDLNFFI